MCSSLVVLAAALAVAWSYVGDLDVQVNPSAALLEDTPGTSCAGENVPALRFAFTDVKIGWKNPEALGELSVVIVAQNPHFKDGLFLCELSQAEIDALFGLNNQTLAGRSRASARCPLQCGGIVLADPTSAFTADGTLTVAGRYGAAPGGRHFANQLSVPITLTYIPRH